MGLVMAVTVQSGEGELFESSYFGSERLGYLLPQPMPGGDLASKVPSRMVLGILSEKLWKAELEKLPLAFPQGDLEFSTVMKQLETGINVVRSSSTGRVLDAAAALLGICNIRTYDGEPAMKLESAANKSTHVVDLPVVFKKEKNSGVPMLDTTELLLEYMNFPGNTPRLILLLRLRKVLQRESQNLLCRLPQKGDLKDRFEWRGCL